MENLPQVSAKDYPHLPPERAEELARVVNETVRIMNPLTPEQRLMVLAELHKGSCKLRFTINTSRAEIDKFIEAAKLSPEHMVPLPEVMFDEWNYEHDMAKGPCACGATH